jgi:hypothetical protein
MSEAVIKSLNNLSGNIYPGMVRARLRRESGCRRGPTWRSCSRRLPSSWAKYGSASC